MNFVSIIFVNIGLLRIFLSSHTHYTTTLTISGLLFPSAQAEFEITALRFTNIKYTHPVCISNMNRSFMTVSPDSFSQISHHTWINSRQCYLGSGLGTCLPQLLASLLPSNRSASGQNQADQQQLALR